jgi:hypothetical protein
MPQPCPLSPHPAYPPVTASPELSAAYWLQLAARAGLRTEPVDDR